MHVIVIGAGIIGVTTAWFLRKTGHDVTVVERRDQPGLETSFANAGQISANLADPWANPSTLKDVSHWLFRDDTPLVFRPKFDLQQWIWLLKFLRECPADRYQSNLIHLANLGVYSRTALQALRAELDIEYDGRQSGILLFFTEPEKFQAAAQAAKNLQPHGFRREVLTAEQCLEIEPALNSVRAELKGGIYSRYDETGDAFKFTQRLAALAAAAGVKFEFDTTVRRINTGHGALTSIDVVSSDGSAHSWSADGYVLCSGVAAARLARKIGVRLDIYPVKGYSVTFPLPPAADTLSMGLTDAARKMAFSRLGDRLRATAIAEIAGYDVSIDQKRCAQIVANAKRLFGERLDTGQAEYWAGLRPMTPSNLPIIGKSSAYPNLFINAGHGTIGWTQSCGSAQAIADIVAGKAPQCDFPFIGLQ